ncbi:hypothetical protein SEA_CARON_64 [Microbacterium phage Caron]|uniref:Uncharacterized protein n=1 Tax=Microbacterium phage Caron TaxID=3028494 RepID=A0AAE9ZLJ5_9CAUD|nr:hypothetical protein SEA_CARON_64 [Microbacterium phage Caron]
MPNRLVEDAGRDHVYKLRHTTRGDAELGPDALLLGPLLERLDKAVADVLEYALDVSGGVDGITDTFMRLRRLAFSLPGGPLAEDPEACDLPPIPLNLASILATPEGTARVA